MNQCMVKGIYLAKRMQILEKHDVNGSHKLKDKERDTTIISKTIANEGHKHNNLNLEGVYLHVLGDALQSVGVIIGGAAIW